VKSLCIGHLGEDERDILLVGTISHVLAYRIEDNADVFYKEVSQVQKFGNKVKWQVMCCDVDNSRCPMARIV